VALLKKKMEGVGGGHIGTADGL